MFIVLMKIKKHTTFVFKGTPGKNSIRWPLFSSYEALGVGNVTLGWSVRLGGRKDDGSLPYLPNNLPPTQGKIRTRSPRHSREVWS